MIKTSVSLRLQKLLYDSTRNSKGKSNSAKLIAHSFIFTTTFLELGLLSLFSKVKRGMFKKLLGYWFGAKA